jgi:hypothetical protein
MCNHMPGGKVTTIYVDPQRHAEENGYAEVACSITEVVIKSLLYERNLPPSWWQRCAADALFLLNRFPVVSSDVAMSLDGDMARPLELLTRFCYSRRQIDRELSYYVPVGTPCLVHDPRIKGSALRPKTRWGIACGMYREQVWFYCPFTKSKWRSKSYSAYRLKSGINPWQFLRLPEPKSSRKSMDIPQDIQDVQHEIKLRGPLAHEEFKFVDVTPRHEPIANFMPHLEPDTPEESGGSLRVLDHENRLLEIDRDDGEMYYVDDDQEVNHDRSNSEDQKQQQNQISGGQQQMFIDPNPNQEQDANISIRQPSIDRQISEVPHATKATTNTHDQPSENKETPLISLSPMEGETPAMARDAMRKGAHAKRSRAAASELPSSKTTKQTGSALSKPQPKQILKPNPQETLRGDIGFVDEFERVAIEDSTSDEIEALAVANKEVVTVPSDSFKYIVHHRLKLGFGHKEIYHQWLIQEHNVDPEAIPIEPVFSKVRPGIKLPYPSGKAWRQLVSGIKSQKHAYSTSTESDFYQDRMTEVLIEDGKFIAKMCHDSLYYESCVLPLIDKENRGVINEESRVKLEANAARLTAKDIKALARARRRKESSRGKAVGSGEEAPPKSLREAFNHPERGEEWRKAALKEFDGLTDMGVFDHDYSWDDLRKVGINPDDKPPIPLSVCLTHKFDKEGVLDRLKVRMAIAGHPGNMQRGVHYDKTFAATPGQHSNRMLQALLVRNKWNRLTWDIKMAYCWAEVPANELFAIKYPKGFERVNEKGEPLYAVVRRNLYGSPAASRAWSKARDDFILHHFNKNGWQCNRCINDPALFYITFSGEKGVTPPQGVNPGDESVLLVHTDDCDCIGSSIGINQFIADAMHKRWEIKITDPEFMLGVKRTLNESKEEFSVELTMTSYIDGMIKAFEEFEIPKYVKTPFPEHSAGHISKYDVVSDDEVKRVLDRGWMRLVGMCLWASRNVFIECSYGTSLMCSVMSKPSEKSWKAGMHMLAWLRQNRLRGLKFSSKGNSVPIAFSDSSFHHGVKENKVLKPNDCKDQYGWVIMWQGGPVAWASRKHAHVGRSTAHVEYMALSQCYSNIICFRQLLEELFVDDVNDRPTIIFGDNKAANILTEEHFVSSGNQYILSSYHCIKEGYQLGLIKVLDRKSKENISDILTKNVGVGEIDALLGQLTGYELIDFLVEYKDCLETKYDN